MIEVKNLTKSYKKNKGINDFTYHFEQGTIYGICGPNGAGKTTLLKLITQFLNKDSGTITKNFENNTMLNNISYYPDFDVFIKGTVKKNIDFFTMTYEDADKDIIHSVLELFNIGPKEKISSLSTGQKKAVRFALTIARKTKAYIMDEPFANIDIDTRAKFKKLIFDLIDIENSVIIISSHELHDMDSLLDEIILIKDAEYLTSEKVEAIKASKSESLAEWYIESIK